MLRCSYHLLCLQGAEFNTHIRCLIAAHISSPRECACVNSIKKKKAFRNSGYKHTLKSFFFNILVYIFKNTGVFAHVYRSQRLLSGLSHCFPPDLFEAEHLGETGVCCLASKPWWLSGPPSPYCDCRHISYVQVLGTELRFSCSHSKHFMHWAISQAPLKPHTWVCLRFTQEPRALLQKIPVLWR